jgi:hypothetical protein
VDDECAIQIEALRIAQLVTVFVSYLPWIQDDPAYIPVSVDANSMLMILLAARTALAPPRPKLKIQETMELGGSRVLANVDHFTSRLPETESTRALPLQ